MASVNMHRVEEWTIGEVRRSKGTTWRTLTFKGKNDTLEVVLFSADENADCLEPTEQADA